MPKFDAASQILRDMWRNGPWWSVKRIAWWLSHDPASLYRLLLPKPREPQYHRDGMALLDRNTAFLQEPRFRAAYEAGMRSGHKIMGGGDLGIEWRVYVACWAASHALKIPGDLVECGVNTGMMSLAICHYTDFNNTDRNFWLFDTYNGIPMAQALPEELDHAMASNTLNYEECFHIAQRNFAPFPRATLVRGRVPDTLATVPIGKVSYLSLDMNITPPERAALEFFWPKMSSGAIVVLDDYGFLGFEPQHRSADEFAASVNVSILTLPTGQGIIIKP